MGPKLFVAYGRLDDDQPHHGNLNVCWKNCLASLCQMKYDIQLKIKNFIEIFDSNKCQRVHGKSDYYHARFYLNENNSII